MSSDPPSPGPLARAWTLLRWPLAIGVLSWLVYTNVYLYREELLERSVRWWAIAGAVVTFAAALLLTYFRWFLLVRAQDFEFTYPEAVRLGLIGLLFNFVAPGAVGGDIVKGSMIASRQRSRRLIAASTVVLDRCLGSLGLFCVGALAFLFLSAEYQAAFAWLAALFLAGIAVGGGLLGIALWPRITHSRWVVAMTEWRFVGRPLRGILDSVGLYQANRRVVGFCVVISLVAHVSILTTFYLCSMAVSRGSGVPGYAMQAVIGSGSNFIQAFIPTPGGTGALEGAIAAGYLAADRAKVDHLRETHDPTGGPPPDWQSSFEVAVGDRETGELAKVAEGSGAEPGQLAASLTGLESDDEAAASAFTTGIGDVPADSVWAAYRIGHTAIAYREGFLAALAYRVLTVCVAVIGAMLYYVSRREIDSAIEARDEPAAPESTDSPAIASDGHTPRVGQRITERGV